MSKLTDLIIDIGAEPTEDMRYLTLSESVLHKYTERVTRGLVEALKYYADGEHIRHLSNGDCVFEYGDISHQALTAHRELIGGQE